MERAHLEHFLNKGYELGFAKDTGDPHFIGWILLSKREPDDRYLSLLRPGEEPEFVAEQELFRARPYQVIVQELDRAVFDSDRYETEEDFRINEVRYFPSLDEVEEFVQQYGHTLKDIEWRTEIDAP